MQILEQLFGIAPDGGSGSLEVAFAVLVTGIVMVAARRLRRSRRG